MLLLSLREFELIQRISIFRFSIGSKGARDDGSYFCGKLVTSQLKHRRIWKALDNIDLNQMSHRYVSGVLQNESSTSAHLIDRCENVNLSLKRVNF